MKEARLFFAVAVCLWVAAFGSVAQGATNHWLGANAYNAIQVVVADTASPSEHYASKQFQEYWGKLTGYTPVVSSQPGRGVKVWIGRAGVPAALLAKLKLEGLGDDGYCIRTVDDNLLIVGAERRGTMYGVFRFLINTMGIRFLTPEDTYIPSAPAFIPAQNIRYIPPLRYRDTNYWIFTRNPEFALKHGLNGNSLVIPEEMGGHIGFANGFGHTLYSFVDPEEYFAAHPEYFSEVNGKRMKESQLCLTNPEVLRIVTEKIRALLRTSPPHRRIVSVTQMDRPFWCTCPKCRALDEHEGSQSGSMIHFVNQIADAIKDEFPDAYIDTFAYTYTRKPPKHVKPRDNAIVRLCSIEADFARPLADRHSALNRAFQKDITAWSRIAKNLFIWDYTQNWHAFQGPHPNLQVLQPNVEFFVQHGVSGLFEQSAHCPSADLEYAKAYIVGNSEWNPKADWQALYDEFLRLYYREGAPYLREYRDLLLHKVLQDNIELTIFETMDWMDRPMVEQAEAIFQRAFKEVGDPVILERMKRVYISVQYAALVCPPQVQYAGDRVILDRPPCVSLEEYWDVVNAVGGTHIGDDPFSRFRERLHNQTPPRHQELELARLQNARQELWVLPDAGGSIVRWRDLKTGQEVFKGYEKPWADRWSWQEWSVMDNEDPDLEVPVAVPYRVAERNSDSLTIEATLPTGVVIRRTMTLQADSPDLAVTVTLKNATDKPIAARFKPHPEFWMPGKRLPEIWVNNPSGWRRVKPQQVVDSGAVGFGNLDPATVSRWGFWLPKAKFGVVSAVDPADVESLFFFYNLNRNHVNLEFVPKTDALAPGQSRSVRAQFRIVDKRPDKG